jgi:hypothetical protein
MPRYGEPRRFWKNTSLLCPKAKKPKLERNCTNWLPPSLGVLAEKLQDRGEAGRIVVQPALAQVLHKFPLRSVLEYLGDFSFRLLISR